MIKIKIVAVGSIKERFYKEAIEEYLKRLSRFAKTEIVEVEETKIQNKPPEKVLLEEGERILKRIKENEYVFLLDLRGEIIKSEELADKIANITSKNYSQITFVIGGTLGLSNEVRKRANFSISISKMTFTHQMCRVIILEQIYRAFKIINHEDYHH